MNSTAFAGVPRVLGTAIHAHRWLIGLVAAYVAICAVLADHGARLGALSLSMYGGVLPIASVILLAIAALRALHLLLRNRPARPIGFLLGDMRAFLTAERVAAAAVVFVVLPPFMSVFTSMKDLIPVLNPYHWDPALAALDRAIHGGHDPWRIVQAAIGGHAWITVFLSGMYQLWFLFIFGAWFALAFSTARPRLRMQYFIAAILAWACIGTFAAIALSSGGPAYYGRLVGGPDPFVPLMAYLRGVDARTPIFALHIQDMLWNAYQGGHQARGSGISAMPSVHVATTLLFALLLRRYHRVLGLLGFGFLGCIMVGSVHLGWHYAVDGYVSVAAALILWRLAGWLTGRMPEFADARAAVAPPTVSRPPVAAEVAPALTGS